LTPAGRLDPKSSGSSRMIAARLRESRYLPHHRNLPDTDACRTWSAPTVARASAGPHKFQSDIASDAPGLCQHATELNAFVAN
jgi:hypothetical protein